MADRVTGGMTNVRYPWPRPATEDGTGLRGHPRALLGRLLVTPRLIPGPARYRSQASRASRE
jgi:hypothetical protein